MTTLRKNQVGQPSTNGGHFATKTNDEAEAIELSELEDANALFQFEWNGRSFDVDAPSDPESREFSLYEDGDHVLVFQYSGDREDHLSIEDSAVQALSDHNV